MNEATGGEEREVDVVLSKLLSSGRSEPSCSSTFVSAGRFILDDHGPAFQELVPGANGAIKACARRGFACHERDGGGRNGELNEI